MRRAAIAAEEGHEHGAGDIEGSHAGGDHADPVDGGRVLIGGEQDGVLTEEAGERGDAGDGDPGADHGPEGDRNLLAQAAHVAHVLLAGEGVDYAARAEEEQRLEDCLLYTSDAA